MLKEAILKEMNEVGDSYYKIIYEDSRFNKKLSLESLVIVVKSPANSFKVYQGYLHSSGHINVSYIAIYEDMFNAMTSSNSVVD